jgi:hypothetical protein
MLIKVAYHMLWRWPFSWLYGGLVNYITRMSINPGILERSPRLSSSLPSSHLSWVLHCEYAFSRPVLSFPLNFLMCQRTRYSCSAGPVPEYEDTRRTR